MVALVVGGASAQAARELVERGRQDEHAHGAGELGLDLTRALVVDVEHDADLALAARALELGDAGAVEVAVDLGPLDELARLDALLKLFARR